MDLAATRAQSGASGRTALALGLMGASGSAALGCQIVWTQQSAVWLGHESAAVLAVVGAFFGGLALGALALGARIERSARPARWYAGCEALIGLWTLALAALLAPVGQALLVLTGATPSPAWQWTVGFAGTFVLLLPATAAMGATLPAIERVLARLGRTEAGTRPTITAPIAALYAANTVGAMAGVLAAAFWLVPAFGLLRTAAACSLLNLGCALLAWRRFDDADPVESAPLPPAAPSPGTAHGRRLPWLLAATGLLGIGFEVLVVRVLSQVAENTVYTFALLLAVYLAGSAAGAAAWQRLRAAADPASALSPTASARLLAALAAACLLGTATLWQAQAAKAALHDAFGPGMAAALAAEAMLAVAAFALPTVVMGALFTQLASASRQVGFGFARALGVNTLGAALAPALFGVLALPAFGAKGALILIVAGYLALALACAPRTTATWAVAGGALVAVVAAPPLVLVDVPEGGRLVRHIEGSRAAVSVVEDAAGVAWLKVDNRQPEGGSATRWADARQALLPLLLHPAPRHALFLGYGTGVTAAAAAGDAALAVNAVELLPEVIEAARHFTDAPQPRLSVFSADARRYVRAATTRYDLVVADNFHPARSGSGALYTVEHFGAVAGRLSAGGLFCQWLPLHQMDLRTLRSVVRSFVAVFPDAHALLATNSLETPVLGLVAREGGTRFDAAAVRARLAGAALPERPAAFGLPDELALLGSFVAGPPALARFAGDAPLNTDDHPVVTYQAPHATYAPESRPRDRLLALLQQLELAPGTLLGATAEPAFAARLVAYVAARNDFVAAGRDVVPSADAMRMLAQVREPLLAVLRTSAEFRPAYDPLLRLAVAALPRDETAARTLLAELARLQPARPEAAQALRRLAGSGAP